MFSIDQTRQKAGYSTQASVIWTKWLISAAE